VSDQLVQSNLLEPQPVCVLGNLCKKKYVSLLAFSGSQGAIIEEELIFCELFGQKLY